MRVQGTRFIGPRALGIVFTIAGVAILTMLWLASPASAAAQRDYVSCGHFETQADAQEALETIPPELRPNLDGDSDGIACEDAFDETGTEFVQPGPVGCEGFETREAAQEFFDSVNHSDPGLMDPDGDGNVCEFVFGDVDSPPAVVDPVSCGHFETQADAQVYFETTRMSDPSVLDPDGDGFACEVRFGERTGGPPAFDPVSCGHFESQQAAQEFFDQGTLDDPSVLDWDGDGIACEDAFAGNQPAEEETETTSVVVSLPNTGTGPQEDSDADLFLAVAVLLLTGGLWISRKQGVQ